jgi:hypothetical protein
VWLYLVADLLPALKGKAFSCKKRLKIVTLLRMLCVWHIHSCGYKVFLRAVEALENVAGEASGGGGDRA